jgi:hypothetical protein
VKRCAASLFIREMKIKTIMKYHPAIVKIVTRKKNLDEDVQKLQHLHTVGEGAKCYTHVGKQDGVSSKIRNRINM